MDLPSMYIGKTGDTKVDIVPANKNVGGYPYCAERL